MLNCKQSSQLISQSLDRKLTIKERFALKFHLLICRYCKRFSQQLKSLSVMLKGMTADVENDTTIKMSSSSKKRIAESIASAKD